VPRKKTNNVKKKTTKKTKLKKTPRDKKIEKQQPWLTEEEFNLEFRNQFPTIVEEIDKYIEACEEEAKKREPSFEVDSDLRLFKAYRWGWAVGYYESTEQILNHIKTFKSVKNQEAETLRAREELEKIGIDPIHDPNLDRLDPQDDNVEANDRFNNWWNETIDPEQKEKFKPFTFDDFDKYEAISFGAYLNMAFEDFDNLIKRYCWSRKRVGFWRHNEWGTATFHFDVINEKELNEVSKDYQIRQAKRVLEDEGYICKAPPDYSTGI
jgi:hypothetical protein